MSLLSPSGCQGGAYKGQSPWNVKRNISLPLTQSSICLWVSIHGGVVPCFSIIAMLLFLVVFGGGALLALGRKDD